MNVDEDILNAEVDINSTATNKKIMKIYDTIVQVCINSRKKLARCEKKENGRYIQYCFWDSL